MQVTSLLEQKQVVCHLMRNDVLENIRLIWFGDFQLSYIEGTQVFQIFRQLHSVGCHRVNIAQNPQSKDPTYHAGNFQQ